MSDALKPLMFTVGLVDKITGPAQKAQKSFDDIIQTARTGFVDIGIGAAGLFGSGLAIKSLVEPAIEMEKALGSLASLELPEDQLRRLGQSAIQLSTDLGVSAADITRSAYDIQSAMGVDLTGDELSEFTRASSILAKATLADSKTISSYMSTMYGVFNKTATEMGRADWVNQMSGMTAEAVKMFRTSGPEMAAAFANLTSSAADFGVSMSEQMAILGTLQNVIPSGSEAATAYRGFLAGAQKAQGSLGVQLFADTDMKQLLPIDEILANLEGIGQMDLTSAFGSQEAVKFLSILNNNVGSLRSGLTGLGNVSDMDNAMKMAQANINPWDRLAHSIEAVKIGFGSALLPVLNPLVNQLTSAATVVYDFTEMFPNITRLVGSATAIVIGFTGAMAALTAITGIARVVTQGWLVLVKAMRGVTVLWTAAQWGLNAAIALAASPITAVVLIVTAAIGAMVALAYGVKQAWSALSDLSWSEHLGTALDWVMGLFDALKETAGEAIGWVIDKINLIPGINIGAEIAETPTLPEPELSASPVSVPVESLPILTPEAAPVSVGAELSDVTPLPDLAGSLSSLVTLPTAATEAPAVMPGVAPVVAEVPGTVTPAMEPAAPVAPVMAQPLETLTPDMITVSPLPGEVPELSQPAPMVDVESLAIDIPYRQESFQSEVPSQGAVVRTTNANRTDNSRRTNYVEIHTSQPMTPALLDEMLLMEGG